MRVPYFITGGAALIAGLVIAVMAFRSREPESRPSSTAATAERESWKVAGSSSTDEGQDPETPGGALDPDLPSKSTDRAVDRVAQMERKISRLEKQQRELDSLKDEEKIAYAAGLPVPDNPVEPAFQQLLQSRRDLAGMRATGMGDRHPQVVAQQDVLKAMGEDLDKAMASLAKQMQAELDESRQALQRAKAKP